MLKNKKLQRKNKRKQVRVDSINENRQIRHEYIQSFLDEQYTQCPPGAIGVSIPGWSFFFEDLKKAGYRWGTSA